MIISNLNFDMIISEVHRKYIERIPEVTYILVVSSEYYVRMRFCSDKNNSKNNGILKASVGVPERATFDSPIFSRYFCRIFM